MVRKRSWDKYMYKHSLMYLGNVSLLKVRPYLCLQRFSVEFNRRHTYMEKDYFSKGEYQMSSKVRIRLLFCQCTRLANTNETWVKITLLQAFNSRS